MFGDCTESAPFMPTARAKHNAWKSHSGKSRPDAEREYIDLVRTLCPQQEGASEETKEVKEVRPMGGVMSAMGEALEGREEYDTPLTEVEGILETIHEAIRAGSETIDLKGLDVNTANREGFTFLHIAADSGNICVARQLVEQFGADVNSSDIDGVTALHMAVDIEDAEMVQYLLSLPGTNREATDNEMNTPLQHATPAIARLFA